jgi:hypothetical protein
MNITLGDSELACVSGGREKVDANYSGCTVNGTYGTYTNAWCDWADQQAQITAIVQNVRNIVYGPKGK